MPKRSSKQDENEIAKSIVNQATGEEPKDEDQDEKPEKNPAAVALGKLGGKKGGPARAKKLSESRRKEIAKKAAEARWGKRK